MSGPEHHMPPTPSLPGSPGPLPTGWKNRLILTAFAVAGFFVGIPVYIVLALLSAAVLSFLAATWAWYIGLVLSLSAIAVILIKYRRRRYATYALAFTIGMSVLFAYCSLFAAIGRL